MSLRLVEAPAIEVQLPLLQLLLAAVLVELVVVELLAAAVLVLRVAVLHNCMSQSRLRFHVYLHLAAMIFVELMMNNGQVVPSEGEVFAAARIML